MSEEPLYSLDKDVKGAPFRKGEGWWVGCTGYGIHMGCTAYQPAVTATHVECGCGALEWTRQIQVSDGHILALNLT